MWGGIRFTVACCALLLAACESAVGPGGGADAELRSLPRALSTAETQVIEASNSFAFDLGTIGEPSSP